MCACHWTTTPDTVWWNHLTYLYLLVFPHFSPSNWTNSLDTEQNCLFVCRLHSQASQERHLHSFLHENHFKLFMDTMHVGEMWPFLMLLLASFHLLRMFYIGIPPSLFLSFILSLHFSFLSTIFPPPSLSLSFLLSLLPVSLFLSFI